MRATIFLLITLALLGPPCLSHAQTVLVHDRHFNVLDTRPDADGLWLSSDELKSVTGFEVKEQGACRGELCLPIRKQQRITLIDEQDGKPRINFEAFLKFVRYPYIVDHDENVWSIGHAGHKSAEDQATLAPDFSLEDRNGKTVRLSDFRKQKVILFTWASW